MERRCPNHSTVEALKANRYLRYAGRVLQAWGAYGTIWPVVHQWFGVRPDLGRDRLEVTPQVPPGHPDVSGENVRVGDGSIDGAASADDGTYRTVVDAELALERLVIGHTVPDGAGVSSITLDGCPADYEIRVTNRRCEVLVARPTRPVGARWSSRRTRRVLHLGSDRRRRSAEDYSRSTSRQSQS